MRVLKTHHNGQRHLSSYLLRGSRQGEHLRGLALRLEAHVEVDAVGVARQVDVLHTLVCHLGIRTPVTEEEEEQEEEHRVGGTSGRGGAGAA